MTTDNERMQILEMINSGAITAEDGLRLLKALDGNSPLEQDELEVPAAVSGEPATLDWDEKGLPPVPPVPPLEENFPAVEIPPLPPMPMEANLRSISPAFKEHEQTERDGSENEARGSKGEDSGETHAPHSAAISSEIDRWRRWWWIPLWIGVAITLTGAGLMFLAYIQDGLGFWFACAWMPFLLGVGVMALAYASSRMRWLHLRVHQKGHNHSTKVNLSLPLPLRFISFIVKIVGNWVPDIREKGVDQMLLALEATNSDQPFYIEVDDDDDDERVEIYIG